MGVIFISHSSKNNQQAVRVRDWLRNQGWAETFLDLDPEHGLAPGHKWQEELKRAGERCSAVVVLVSPEWAASKWCLTEFLLASQLGKRVFPVIIAPTPFEDLPFELTAHFQLADISDPATESEGFERLRFGIQRAGLDPKDFPWPPPEEPGRLPYRGLSTLEEKDAAIFFGRDADITKGLDALRRMRDGASERILVILGASGAGKSSFLRAGLLSRLKRDTENFIVLPLVRPERAALTGPTGVLNSLGVDAQGSPDEMTRRLEAIRQPVTDNFRRLADAAGDSWTGKAPTIVIPIDQAEELFSADHEEAGPALFLLTSALQASDSVVAILTMRSDSLERLQGAPYISAIPRLPFELTRLPLGAFNEVILGPGKLAVPPIAVDPDLTNRLTKDLNDEDALPLLAFTLERLLSEFGSDGVLKLSDYETGLGGLKGAITRSMELAFASALENPALPKEQSALEDLARRAFIPWLVRIEDPASAPKRRVALLSELPEDTLPLIRKFVDQRLLVSDTRPDGTLTIEVSHEAVLRNWPRLQDWIAEEQDTLGRAERVIRAATEWGGAVSYEQTSIDRSDLMLIHRGERLTAAETLLQRPDMAQFLGVRAHIYLAACRAREDGEKRVKDHNLKRQRQLQGLVNVLAFIAFLFTLGIGWLVVLGQRDVARSTSSILAASAEKLDNAEDLYARVRLAILASRQLLLSPAAPEARSVLATSAQGLSNFETFYGFRSESRLGNYSEFFKDEIRTLSWSDEGIARIINVRTGERIGAPLKHAGALNGVRISEDQSRILTWSADATARIWSARTGKQIGPSFKHAGGVNYATFSEDETKLLTSSEDHTVRLWDVNTGQQIGPAFKHAARVRLAYFAKNETRILTESEDQTVRLWDLSTRRQIGPTWRQEVNFVGRQTIVRSADLKIQVLDERLGELIGAPIKYAKDTTGVAFSQDESRILTWSTDGTARLWDIRTGKQIGAAFNHNSAVRGAIFSKDESRVVAWSQDGAVRVWDTRTGNQIGPRLMVKDGADRVTYFQDQERILVRTSGADELWDARTGKRLLLSASKDGRFCDWLLGQVAPERLPSYNCASDGTSVEDTRTGRQLGPFFNAILSVISNDETKILVFEKRVGSEVGSVRIIDARSGERIGPALKNVGRFEDRAVLSKDAAKIIIYSRLAGTVGIWNTRTGEQIGPGIKHDAGQNEFGTTRIIAGFSEDETEVLIRYTDGRAKIMDARTGKPIEPVLQHEQAVHGAVFSKDETRILTWSADGLVRLWNARTLKQIGPVFQHDGAVTGAKFSKDENRVLSWGFDGTVRLWDTRTGKQIGPALQHEQSILSAAYFPDQERILSLSYDHKGRLWDARTGKQIGPDWNLALTSGGAIFNQDATRILTWQFNGPVRLLDARTGTQVGPALNSRYADGSTFSKDGTRVLTWNLDDTVNIFDVRTGKEVVPPLRNIGGIVGATFSMDQTRILTWDNERNAHLWDARTGKQIGARLQHGGGVLGATFSKTGVRVLTWSNDGNVRLWDTRTSKQMGPALKHQDFALGATFSKDEAHVLTWSRDHTVRIWPVSWIMNDDSSSKYIANLCEGMLDQSDRRLAAKDIEAAPILRGREGEDVCAWTPPWYDSALNLLVGWAFR